MLGASRAEHKQSASAVHIAGTLPKTAVLFGDRLITQLDMMMSTELSATGSVSNHYANIGFNCSTEGTLPTTLTAPSTTSAGVIITPKLMIWSISVTFSSSYSIPSACAAFSACSVSLGS